MHGLAFFVLLSGLAVPVATQDSDGGCQDELSDKNLDHEHVHLLLDIAILVAAQLRIHHDARVLASINDEADDPLGIFKHCAFQK